MKEQFYKVYLTRSHEVAGLIYDAHHVGTDGIINTSYGLTEGREEIPLIYNGQGYYCCVITREADVPGYELIIA